jgi:hypothetical protein
MAKNIVHFDFADLPGLFLEVSSTSYSNEKKFF